MAHQPRPHRRSLPQRPCLRVGEASLLKLRRGVARQRLYKVAPRSSFPLQLPSLLSFGSATVAATKPPSPAADAAPAAGRSLDKHQRILDAAMAVLAEKVFLQS